MKWVNPLRVGLTIIVGILAIYVAILWDRSARLERDLAQVKARNAELKIQLDGMRNRLNSVDRRLPMGEFRLGGFPARKTESE